MSEAIFHLLCSSAKIDRDKGFIELQKYLQTLEEEDVQQLETDIQRRLADSTASWEQKHGALMGSKAVLQNKQSSDEFAVNMRQSALDFCEDKEFRVRIAAGEVMGELCRKIGPEIYGRSKAILLEGVQTNLERNTLTDTGKYEQEETEKLMEKLSSSPKADSPRRNSADASQIFHDTAGWKSLETWMKCLKEVIEGCGYLFNSYVDQELLDLIFSALTHTNRFVRETGYYVCASLVACGFNEQATEEAAMLEGNAIYQHGHEFAQHLSNGLADNWSQVRLASSVATRKFLESLPSNDARQQFYPELIPKMCLNRYYVAEGVRIFSQETWRHVTAGEGRHLVEKYINQVVEYYIIASDADNHAVREAACACIAELGSKVDKTVVRTYIPRLLDALLICFNDESWPVRDAACVACGNFVLCFPEESQATLPSLYPLFFNNLQDNIASVRQGAALAVANVVQAYGQESLQVIMEKVKDGLEGIEKQPENTEKYSGLEKGPATYGVVKKLRDNDMDIHTDKQMYSCGSLAPKMGRGREGGCMDHKFRKPPEPWELTDGCIHLLAELSNHHDLAPEVSKMMPHLAKAASYQHYTAHLNLLESLCKQLPNIGRGIGKRHFKMHLESFFDAVFYSLSSDNALTASAASQCLNQLSSFLGPGILRGRVEQHNPKYLQQLDANQFIAPL